jgi:deazaflavin-dependent oxidoreductase (nitroreductase family)
MPRPLPHAAPTPPHGLRRMILRLMSSRAFGAVERSLPFRLVVWRLTPRLMRLTGGRLAALLPVPVAVLETRDLRNGRPHRRVVIYFHDDERITVVPSRSGGPRDPFWYENALANPAVRFGYRDCRAEAVVDETARARLWELADRFYPPYVAYREHAARSGRTIPILQLVTTRTGSSLPPASDRRRTPAATRSTSRSSP